YSSYNSRLVMMLIGVHRNLESTRRLYPLTVHSLPHCIHGRGRRLDNGLRSHPEANEGGFHRVICDFISLPGEVCPHCHERFVFCRLDRIEVIPGRQVPDGDNAHVEQFALADGESHDWNRVGVDMLGCELPVEVCICIPING